MLFFSVEADKWVIPTTVAYWGEVQEVAPNKLKFLLLARVFWSISPCAGDQLTLRHWAHREDPEWFTERFKWSISSAEYNCSSVRTQGNYIHSAEVSSCNLGCLKPQCFQLTGLHRWAGTGSTYRSWTSSGCWSASVSAGTSTSLQPRSSKESGRNITLRWWKSCVSQDQRYVPTNSRAVRGRGKTGLVGFLTPVPLYLPVISL